MHALTFDQALVKGYPEYREDQARGDDGRWSGGDGMRAARTKLTGKQLAARDYKRKFGHAPPASMSAQAMRRWISGPFKTAPGKGKTKEQLRTWREEQRQRADESERQRIDRNRQWREQNRTAETEWANRDLPAAAERKRAETDKALQDAKDAVTAGEHKEVGKRTLDAYDSIRSVPDGAWRNPTFADHVMKTLLSWEVTMATMITGGIVTIPWGLAVATTATYLMMRYVRCPLAAPTVG